MTRSLAALLAVLLLAPAVRAAEPPAPANAEIAVNFFVKSCLKHYRDPQALREKVGIDGAWRLPRLPKDLTRGLLGAEEGGAWLLQPDRDPFALVLRDDGICSVFARKAEEKAVLAKLDAWFAGQAFFAREEVDSAHEGTVTRRFYEVVPGGIGPREVMQMTVSTSVEPDVGFQAVLSLTSPRPAGKQ